MTNNRTPGPWELFTVAERAARAHARHCYRCFVPIIDDEGNPGYRSEACATGYPILEAYIAATEAVA